jgi:hypothetical protein
MALLVTSVFGVTGCGSDDEPPAESRIKNSTGGDNSDDLSISNPGLSKMEQIKKQQEMDIDDLVKQTENNLLSSLSEVNDAMIDDMIDDLSDLLEVLDDPLEREEDKLRHHREDIDEDMYGGINEEDQHYGNNADYLDDIGDDINDIHDGPQRDTKLKDVDELMFKPKSGDTIYDMDDMDDMDDESSIKCSHSTARISPNDSNKSLSKSFCE